jgi:hypothetical protein
LQYQDFREAGFRIFGLYPIKGKSCGCGDPECKVPGKHPYSSSWQHSPEWSDDQIEVMKMTGQLSTGYGVLCRGLIVVDIDARNGGVDSWAKLAEAVPDLANCGLIVATGSGNGSRHLYFTAPEGVAMVTHLPEFKGIDFKSSGYVVGPGSLHASGARYEVLDGDAYSIGTAPDALVALLRKPERHRAEYNGGVMDVSHDDLADMLSFVNPDCDHDTWIKCGMACHEASAGTGFAVWDQWSANGSKYPDDGLEKRWHSFGKSANPVTIGTLIYHAEQGGWIRSVVFDEANAPVTDTPHDGLPFDISGVDLNCPPGLVGVVTEWINDQCRRPRRKLAVAAALTAMGNLAGLRYTDAREGATCNLFTFCVAGSRTGKEAVQQAVADIHRAAGIIAATHGSIKSEKEIVSNLVRHQSALYVVDEIGELLRKIKNAQDKGGAVYLDGVIGMLMSAYSKANKYMLLQGDRKEEVREMLLKEKALLLKGDVAEDDVRIGEIDRAIVSIDSGLEKPFLSLHGYTIPETFDSMVDHRSATNGFIGRSLLFYERETVPRAKRGFKARPMPDPLKMTFMQLYSGGEFEVNSRARVQFIGDRIEVPSTADAERMLDAVLDWIEDSAENQKGRSGLEALVLGAYELVAKVSLILSVGEGLRTAEHVRWAFALVRNDIEEKIALVVSNDRAKDAPALALKARILGLVSGDDGETSGVIINRCRGYKRADIETALAALCAEGHVSKEEKVHSKSKKVVARYKKA